jgi:hypothetical protein
MRSGPHFGRPDLPSLQWQKNGICRISTDVLRFAGLPLAPCHLIVDRKGPPGMPGRCSFLIVPLFCVGCSVLLSTITTSCDLASDPTRQVDTVTRTNTPAAPTPESAAPLTEKSTSAPTDIWLSLLEQDPFPYTTALPPLSPTELDGLYAKLEPSKGTPVPCRRCPDYLPEGGVWKLSLDDGAFRIFHPFTGWHSLGSFTVSGRRFVVSNDPACYREVGVYTWTLHGGRLSFDVLDDACQVGRRARSFASMPWAACQPPSTDAAVTAQWASPPGCKDAK